jgi:hypothetical protein
MFIKTDAEGNILEYPYSLEQFRRDNRNTSFPRDLTDALLATYNVFPVYVDETPAYNKETQFAQKDIDNPYKNSNGQWVYGWIIQDKSAEQIQKDLEDYRLKVKELIDQARDAEIYKTLFVQINETTTIPVDLRKDRPDIQNISGVTLQATLRTINGDTDLTNFRGADNITYSLTPQETILLGKTVADHYSETYRKAWDYKDLIDSLETIEEIDNMVVIDFS